MRGLIGSNSTPGSADPSEMAGKSARSPAVRPQENRNGRTVQSDVSMRPAPDALRINTTCDEIKAQVGGHSVQASNSSVGNDGSSLEPEIRGITKQVSISHQGRPGENDGILSCGRPDSGKGGKTQHIGGARLPRTQTAPVMCAMETGDSSMHIGISKWPTWAPPPRGSEEEPEGQQQRQPGDRRMIHEAWDGVWTVSGLVYGVSYGAWMILGLLGAWTILRWIGLVA